MNSGRPMKIETMIFTQLTMKSITKQTIRMIDSTIVIGMRMTTRITETMVSQMVRMMVVTTLTITSTHLQMVSSDPVAQLVERPRQPLADLAPHLLAALLEPLLPFLDLLCHLTTDALDAGRDQLDQAIDELLDRIDDPGADAEHRFPPQVFSAAKAAVTSRSRRF